MTLVKYVNGKVTESKISSTCELLCLLAIVESVHVFFYIVISLSPLLPLVPPALGSCPQGRDTHDPPLACIPTLASLELFPGPSRT
jgi:hypothetical protein